MVFSKQSEKRCICGTLYTQSLIYVFVGKNLKMAEAPMWCKIWETWFLWTFGQDHIKSG